MSSVEGREPEPSIFSQVRDVLGNIPPDDPTLADNLRHFMVMMLGSPWQDCSLQQNTSHDGRVSYLALLIQPHEQDGVMIPYEQRFRLLSYQIDRDELGMFHLATPSLIPGDMDMF